MTAIINNKTIKYFIIILLTGFLKIKEWNQHKCEKSYLNPIDLRETDATQSIGTNPNNSTVESLDELSGIN